MKKIIGALFFLLLLSLPVFAEEFKPEDFSGAMVYSGSEGSLLAIDIPLEVYHGLRRPDLGDLRIFDKAGLAVPFIIRERPKEMFTPPPEEVPFFIWDSGKENDLPVDTDIEINTQGGVIRIKNQSGSGLKAPVFLVDLSALPFEAHVLTIKVDNQGKDFSSPVTIHSSKDLSNWTLFSKRQVIASFGGSSFQDTLELPEEGERYLLLSFGMEAPRLQAITVSFKQEELASLFHELIIKGSRSEDGKKLNYFTGGFYPIETIDFLLPEADSIQVIIKNRFSENEEWNIYGRETIFRYNSGDGIEKNSPFSISSSAYRGFHSQAPYWELEAAGALPFNTVPDMVIRWQSRELIFPARGAGPWTLAYGNSACPPLDPAEIFPLRGELKTEAALFTGVSRYEMTGLITPEKRNYSSYFLWIFLGASVLILSILAYKIAKSMRK